MIEKHQLSEFYRDQLKEQILPFWLKNAPDRECGGYASCLDRYGNVYEWDKIDILMQGRISWTFSWMYNEFEQCEEWLDFARLGVDFVLKHGFREDGRIYYALKRDGQPMQEPSIYHAELSNLIAMAELARATNDEALYQKARSIFELAWKGLHHPNHFLSQLLPGMTPTRIHGNSMITINVLQILRSYREEPTDRPRILECIENMRRFHVRSEQQMVLENTGWNGETLKGSEGRRVNPGHMIEGGIFLIHETGKHPDPAIRQLGLDLIRWGFECGWDKEFGGIFNDIDAEGKPIWGAELLLADSKLWWQHAEALYGLLLAYVETEDEWFWRAYEQVHTYSFEKYADPEYGGWFAHLDRTGRRINDAKGSSRKCCYHVGRNFLWSAKVAERFKRASSPARNLAELL